MTVGEQLQHARSERKLSRADVTQGTKIQPWVLEALEADRLQDLMSPIYVKGFLTTYAKFLHLDPVPLIAELRWPQPDPIQQPLPPPSPALPVMWAAPWPLLRRVGTMAAVSAAIVGVLALNPLRRLPRLALSNAGTPRLAGAASMHEAVKPLALPTLTLLATQPLELVVNARRSTWVQVRADGKLLAQHRMERGAKEQWTARKRFELIVAHPSYVEITLNGRPISPYAIAHQGRLLITHHGVAKLPSQQS